MLIFIGRLCYYFMFITDFYFKIVWTYSLYLLGSYIYIFIYIYICYIYINIYIFIFAKLIILIKRSIMDVFLQIISFSKIFRGSHMEYFVYILFVFFHSSMFHQFNVRNIVKRPIRVNLPGIFELSAFICKLLIFVRHTVTNKKFFQKL